MKKYVFALLIFGFLAVIFFSFRKDPIKPALVKDIPESKSAINSSDTSSINPINRIFVSSSSASKLSISSAYAASSSPVISEISRPWTPFVPSQEIQNKVDDVIGNFPTPVTRAFIKVDSDFLEQIEVDGIYEIPIPDAADADMHVVNIEKKDGLISVVGHLSGYPESYYIGFSYDKEGHIYGEITTEKANYSIKTYYEQSVVIKVLPEMVRTSRDDF
jgi:hypothetical protein